MASVINTLSQTDVAKGFFVLTFDPRSRLNEVVWDKQSAILGRDHTKSRAQQNFISVGQFKTISREHGAISWNKSIGHWQLKVISKKGICSNSKLYQEGEVLVLSVDKPTPLKMGSTRFYFCPAQSCNALNSES